MTASLRGRDAAYVGYLNVTPRQGAERLHGWASFRIQRNRGEGDRRVHELAGAEGLSFRRARGSCVIDEYVSRVGAHRYREIACLVSGHRGTDVLVAAALQPDWPALAGTLRRAASAFLQR